MNNTSKRQLNIRNKLIGAIAMLLVSSIMLVSTTYAWFTLSTAPEVQGITTTVGANGNLEIALSPESGDYSQISSSTSDATLDWVYRNLTWGNLLDLSDSSYHFDELTLLPSQLNITRGEGTNPSTLSDNPLKIPVYGSDGRISELDGTKVFMGAYATVGDATGFMANNNKYGVRALGTSSAMSPDAIAFNSALSAMGSNTTTANTIVTNALLTYGSALADMAVTHATVSEGATDENNYVGYVSDLKALSEELKKASDSVETALYNGLLALAKSKAMESVNTGSIEDNGQTYTAYNYIKNSMEKNISLRTVWAKLPTEITGSDSPIVSAYNKWDATDTAVESNASSVAALSTTGTVSWSDVSTAMSGLMNTNNITISGYALSEVKTSIMKIINSGGIVLELNAGSGVIANFGELTGNIMATVQLGNVKYSGQDLSGTNVNIATTTEPSSGPLLTQSKSLITTVGVLEDKDAGIANIIDVIYGYAVDFVFRTNAANSSLLLQTDGAQRIYGDSQNAATMGNGSSITFDGTSNNLESLVSMMSGIRVVFTNTKGDSTEVYGIAKVNFDETEFTLNVIPVTRTIQVTEVPEGETTTTTATEVFTKGTAVEETMKLSVVSAVVNGTTIEKMILTADGLGEHQYIVWETVQDPVTKETYVEATIKTALYCEVTTTITTTPVSPDDNPVETSGTVEVEVLDADGNPVFYGEKETVNDAGTAKVTMTDADFTAWVTKQVPTTGLTYSESTVAVDGSTVVTTGSITQSNAVTKIVANYAAPVYQYVEDQDITLEGPLALYNYTVNATTNALEFTSPMDVQALTTLDQNVATGVTAMVYLDGDYVDNGDVTNSEDGISNTGSLNLQFASSANLVPMQDTNLLNGIGVKFPKVDGLTFTGEEITNKGEEYKFVVTPETNSTKTYNIYAYVEVNGQVVKQHIGAVTNQAVSITISAEYMKTNIEILAEEVVATSDSD